MQAVSIGTPVIARSSAFTARVAADQLFSIVQPLNSIRILACACGAAMQTWIEWRMHFGYPEGLLSETDAAAASAWRFEQSARPLTELAKTEAEKHAGVSAVALTRRGTWLAEQALAFDRSDAAIRQIHPILIDGLVRPEGADFLEELRKLR